MTDIIATRAVGIAEPACSTCRFFRNEECHRHPPTVHSGTWGSYIFMLNTYSTEWPSVNDDDWCGEYEPETRGRND